MEDIWAWIALQMRKSSFGNPGGHQIMLCKSKESKSLARPPPAIPQAALAHAVPVVLLRLLPWHFETVCLVPSKDGDLWGLRRP